VLKGARRREERAYELATFGAWQTARLGRENRLKRLDRYLAELKPAKPQSPAEMLAALRAIAGKSNMKIEKVDAAG